MVKVTFITDPVYFACKPEYFQNYAHIVFLSHCKMTGPLVINKPEIQSSFFILCYTAVFQHTLFRLYYDSQGTTSVCEITWVDTLSGYDIVPMDIDRVVWT